MNIDPWGISLILGTLLASAFCVAIVIASACKRCLAWVKDEKPGERNLLIVKISKLFGYEQSDSIWKYTKGGKKTDGEIFFFYPLVALFLSPTIALLLFKFYALTLFVLLFTGVLHLTRFAFRVSKKLKLHESNSEIHK